MPKNSLAVEFDELVTIRDWVRWGVSQFVKAGLHYGHGTDNAWDEAVSLVLFALNLPYELYEKTKEASLGDARLTRAEKTTILSLFERRIKERKPAAYLIKETWFAGLKFYVDERVIIPRSPIAELLESRFSPWLDAEKVTHVLDLCTGSGCIAITSAFVFPKAQVDAVDLNPQALELAKINVDTYDVQDQVKLIEGDIFGPVSGQYDLIVSNPPYVGAVELADLPEEYRHEPKSALLGGKVGLEIVERILATAHQYLKPQGVLVVEVGENDQLLMERYPQVSFMWLEFKAGGRGVFLMSAAEVAEYAKFFKA